MGVTVKFVVNGETRTVTTDPERPLLDVIREDLNLTGAKYGCGEGQCRACTVLMDGRPITACDTPVSKANGTRIVTIEGLAEGDALHPVQEAFIAEGAMQCGFCVTGMILTAVALLEQNASPTDAQIVEWMNEHRAAGKIRAFGGSNWRHDRIQEANEYAEKKGLQKFTLSSPHFSLGAQIENPWGPGCVTLTGDGEAEAREWYRSANMPVFAYSSLSRG